MRNVAQALERVSLRPADLVARYAGEEFVMLLPYTPRLCAQFIANRALDAVGALDMPHKASRTARNVSVTTVGGTTVNRALTVTN